jgi:pyruvate ferredoxin oxidoreductase alpha subunit
MVCVDGFILTHAFEKINLPSQAQVDAFLPQFEPVQLLDVADPVTIGALVGPDAYAEVRYLLHHKHLRATELIQQVAAAFRASFGRASGGLLTPYRAADAETLVVALGSVNGTIQVVVDTLRSEGLRIGSIKLTSYRPFPLAGLRGAAQHASRVVVIEKHLSPGMGGALASDVRTALRGMSIPVDTVIAGLGGRAILTEPLTRALRAAARGALDEPHFLDLDWSVVDAELRRAEGVRRSGPAAEHVRDLVRRRAEATAITPRPAPATTAGAAELQIAGGRP